MSRWSWLPFEAQIYYWKMHLHLSNCSWQLSGASNRCLEMQLHLSKWHWLLLCKIDIERCNLICQDAPGNIFPSEIEIERCNMFFHDSPAWFMGAKLQMKDVTASLATFLVACIWHRNVFKPRDCTLQNAPGYVFGPHNCYWTMRRHRSRYYSLLFVAQNCYWKIRLHLSTNSWLLFGAPNWRRKTQH